MTKITITGAAGRMGQTIIRCAHALKGVSVTGAVERPGHPDIGKDAGVLAGIGKTGVKIGNDLCSALKHANVLIDFTLHSAVPQNAIIASKLRIPMVIGTTGLSRAESTKIRLAAKKIPIVWAPNMSLGVNLLFAVVRKWASVLGPGYTAEINETHHIHKKDAPSGTALRLGEKIAEGRNIDFKKAMVHNPKSRNAGKLSKGSAGKDKIIIRSHRIGETVGDHTVKFENKGERIELSHHAHSRDAFALGALCAAKWATKRKPGLYDMQDVLGL